jgi:hypothetical protein
MCPPTLEASYGGWTWTGTPTAEPRHPGTSCTYARLLLPWRWEVPQGTTLLADWLLRPIGVDRLCSHACLDHVLACDDIAIAAAFELGSGATARRRPASLS